MVHPWKGRLHFLRAQVSGPHMKPCLAHNPSISLRGITLLELLIVVTIILVFSLVAMNI